MIAPLKKELLEVGAHMRLYFGEAIYMLDKAGLSSAEIVRQLRKAHHDIGPALGGDKDGSGLAPSEGFVKKVLKEQKAFHEWLERRKER